jgi:hypothetical protein
MLCICLTNHIVAQFKIVAVVLYPEKGVCADPVDKGAILGEGGGKPLSSDKERQLAPDIGRGKT